MEDMNIILPEGNDPKLQEYYDKRKVLYANMAKKTPSAQEIVDWYNNEATVYETQFEKAGYGYPRLVAEAVVEVLKDKNGKILDVPAGTGKVAAILRELGFTGVIDGLDGAPNMLEYAKQKNIYHKLHCCMVGSGKIPEIEDGAYDVVCCGAGILRGHFPLSTIPAMLRAVKPSGYFVFNHQDWSAKFEDYSEEAFDEVFEEVKESGLCASVVRRRCTYRPGEMGHMFFLKRGDVVPN